MEKSVSNCFAQDSMLLIDPSDKLDALDLRLGALLLDKTQFGFISQLIKSRKPSNCIVIPPTPNTFSDWE